MVSLQVTPHYMKVLDQMNNILTDTQRPAGTWEEKHK